MGNEKKLPQDMTPEELLAEYNTLAEQLSKLKDSYAKVKEDLKVATETAEALNEELSNAESTEKKGAVKFETVTIDRKKYQIRPGIIHVGKRKFSSAKELAEDKAACAELIAKGSSKLILVND